MTLDYEPCAWSRSPGCYQLKSALAWRDPAEEGGERLYESVLAYSLATHESFLTAEPDREKLMDRLHAYSLFRRKELRLRGSGSSARSLAGAGWGRATAALHREIAPVFERADVATATASRSAQSRTTSLEPSRGDENAACAEASRVASFQAPGDHPDQRLRGGFFFGAKGGEFMPFPSYLHRVFRNAQALELAGSHQHRTGKSCWQR